MFASIVAGSRGMAQGLFLVAALVFVLAFVAGLFERAAPLTLLMVAGLVLVSVGLMFG